MGTRMALTLTILGTTALLGCGGGSPDELLARYRAEGALLPIDATGNTLRFTSPAKYQEFRKTLVEQGFTQQQKVATQAIDADSADDLQGVTATARFDGCRGELTRDVYAGTPAGWKFFSSRTLVDNVYKRGDGYAAGVIAQVALPSSGAMKGDWVPVDALYNGAGYNTLIADYGDTIVVMDGSERKSRHACGWGSKDLECKYWICVDHHRVWHEDWTRQVEVSIVP